MKNAFVIIRQSCTSRYTDGGDVYTDILDVTDNFDTAKKLIDHYAEVFANEGGCGDYILDDGEKPFVNEYKGYGYSVTFGESLDYVEFTYEEVPFIKEM